MVVGYPMGVRYILTLKDADSRGQSGLEDYASKTFMSRHTGDDRVQIELSYVT
jgi:hypothetical protein